MSAIQQVMLGGARIIYPDNTFLSVTPSVLNINMNSISQYDFDTVGVLSLTISMNSISQYDLNSPSSLVLNISMAG